MGHFAAAGQSNRSDDIQPAEGVGQRAREIVDTAYIVDP
jgi:hypothetical protein